MRRYTPRAPKSMRTARIHCMLKLLRVALALFAVGLSAQDTPQAFVGAKVIPIEGSDIDRGVLIVHRGRITAVGPASSTRIPVNAERHEMTGKVVMPGLVDTHSHVGSVEGADRSNPIQPDVRAMDSINIRDARIQRAQAGGITTANIMPGSGHLLSGQTLYVKFRDGTVIDDTDDGITDSPRERRGGEPELRDRGPADRGGHPGGAAEWFRVVRSQEPAGTVRGRRCGRQRIIL